MKTDLLALTAEEQASAHASWLKAKARVEAEAIVWTPEHQKISDRLLAIEAREKAAADATDMSNMQARLKSKKAKLVAKNAADPTGFFGAWKSFEKEAS